METDSSWGILRAVKSTLRVTQLGLIVALLSLPGCNRKTEGGLLVLAYEHGFVARGSGAVVQRLAAARAPVELTRYPLEPAGGQPQSGGQGFVG